MNRLISKYISFDHCRAPLPWFQFVRSRAPFARVRKIAQQLENQADGSGKPSRFIAFFLYIPTSFRQVLIAFSRYAKSARVNFQVPYSTQLADLFYLSWRLNYAPHDYYRQKMWLRPDRRDWAQFLPHREHVSLVKHLQQTLPIEMFDDKLNLHRHMKSSDIPTIGILRASVGGRWLEEFTSVTNQSVLRQDLVIKPTNGTMNEGVEIWRYDHEGNSYWWTGSTKVEGIERSIGQQNSDLPGLLERVRQLSEKHPYVIQRHMKNHPSLDSISPHAIANFRIVTTSQGGEFRAIAALLRMGYDTQRYIADTYQANVDLATGVLGMATGRLPQWGFGKNHIETGALVTGMTVDNWPELKSIAVRAHAQFPWMPSIGWDIINSDQGPMVMEANAFWGADISQVDYRFLGEVGYAEAYLEAHERIRMAGAHGETTADSPAHGDGF